jgi:hypothetical protein
VDATIIAAPSSTKNADHTRDPEMHQTKKGNQWHFGMKAHIGVDAQSGLVHTLVGTAANVSDLNVAGALLHGEEHAAFGDAGYQGVHKRVEAKGPTWHVAMRRGKRRKLNEFIEPQYLAERAEKMKASIRAKVEHPFHVIKNLFRHRKTRYKGLARNTAQLLSLFGLACWRRPKIDPPMAQFYFGADTAHRRKFEWPSPKLSSASRMPAALSDLIVRTSACGSVARSCSVSSMTSLRGSTPELASMRGSTVVAARTSASALRLTNRVPSCPYANHCARMTSTHFSSNSITLDSSVAHSKSTLGICSGPSTGPRISASWPYTAPFRRSTSGWKTAWSRPSSMSPCKGPCAGALEPG